MIAPELLILIGLLVGTLGTLVGAGGGFIMIPVFLFLYPDIEPEKLTALSLIVIFFNALSGSFAYGRKKRIDYRSGLLFAIASVPGALLGATVIQGFDRHRFDPFFGFVIVLLATYLIVRSFRKNESNSAFDLSHRFQLPREKLPLGILLSMGVGFISSLLGIGGGIVHVPLLVQVLGYPVHIATATSHYVMIFMTGAGSITHLINGDLAGRETEILCLAPGVIVGAQVGAKLSERVNGKWIIRILALALGIVGLRLLS